MCEPTTIVMIGAMAVAAYGQAKQADRQQHAALKTANQQAEEKGQQLQEESSIRQMQARRERARMVVAQGESGVALGSSSFEAELANSFGMENRDLQTLQRNSVTASSGLNVRYNDALAGVKTKGQIATEFASNAAGTYKRSGLQIPTG